MLTFPDLAVGRSSNDPYKELKEKLLGKAPDMVSLPRGFIAVKNRDTTKSTEATLPLDEVALRELLWFDQHLPGFVEKGLVSADVLIGRLVDMLCEYIEQTWVPAAVKKVQETILNADHQLKELGVDILAEQLDFDTRKQCGVSPCSELIQAVVAVFEETLHADVFTQKLLAIIGKHVPAGPEPDLSISLTQPVESVRQMRKQRQYFQFCMEKIVTEIPELLSTCISEIFWSSKLPYRLFRFPTLRDHLKDCVVIFCDGEQKRCMQQWKDKLDFALTALQFTGKCSRRKVIEVLVALVVDAVVLPVNDALVALSCTFGCEKYLDDCGNTQDSHRCFCEMFIGKIVGALLQEDEKTSAARNGLKEQKKKLHVVLSALSCLHQKKPML